MYQSKFVAVLVVGLFSTGASAYVGAFCGKDKQATTGDSYGCCSNSDWDRGGTLWVNLAPNYDSCPMGSTISFSCKKDTGIVSSNPPNITVTEDCNNHGYPYVEFSSLGKDLSID